MVAEREKGLLAHRDVIALQLSEIAHSGLRLPTHERSGVRRDSLGRADDMRRYRMFALMILAVSAWNSRLKEGDVMP